MKETDNIRSLSSVKKGCFICLLASAQFVLFASWAAAVPYGANLLVNGNAESGPASSTGGPVASIPGWIVTGSPTVVTYGASGGFPTTTDPGPPDRLNAFFAGGSSASSNLAQSVDVSANAADIDTGQVVCDIGAWLGGYLHDNDYAQFVVTFMKDSSTVLNSAPALIVSPTSRNSLTGLVFESEIVAVPAGTRIIKANLSMFRSSSNGGAYNDGYADSLSVTLRKPKVVTNTSDSGPGSLREAVTEGNTISFDPTVFGPNNKPQVITLNTALPDLNSDMTITGPGANLLSIRRSSASGTPLFRVFTISNNDYFPGPSVTISGLTITNGSAGPLSFGGGVSNSKGQLTMNDCRIVGNSAGFGGGIFCDGYLDPVLTLRRCTVSGNVAATDTQRTDTAGGGIYFNNSGNCILDRCALTGNSAPAGRGGALYLFGSVAFVINSTVSGNSAQSGGAFFIAGLGPGTGLSSLEIDASTVTNNGAASIYDDNANGAPFILADSIVSGPAPIMTESDPTKAGIFSRGFNIVSDTSGNLFTLQKGDRVADPKLGPLQDNGGPTFTHALLPGSPAIDNGDTTILSGLSTFTTDQRGFPRPVDDPNSANGGGNNSDIGAFEYQLPSLPNISTRLRVGTGDNVLIAGFIITGTQPKKVIIRGIGPSLPFADKLADPILELHDSSGALLESNDNWMDSANKQAIIDSTIPPSNPLESAIVRSVAPGNYTAIVRGVNGGTGTGVVEAYDLDASVTSKLVNISTRGLVQTGDNVLIAGTIVVGPANQKVILRALGPSTGVPGAMADPTLELHDSNGTILEANDNWMDSPNKQAIIDSTVPPTNDLESAIVRTLTPANYTAIVRGANNSTGIAVVEVYALN
jgi:hypothetical protein